MQFSAISIALVAFMAGAISASECEPGTSNGSCPIDKPFVKVIIANFYPLGKFNCGYSNVPGDNSDVLLVCTSLGEYVISGRCAPGCCRVFDNFTNALCGC